MSLNMPGVCPFVPHSWTSHSSGLLSPPCGSLNHVGLKQPATTEHCIVPRFADARNFVPRTGLSSLCKHQAKDVSLLQGCQELSFNKRIQETASPRMEGFSMSWKQLTAMSRSQPSGKGERRPFNAHNNVVGLERVSQFPCANEQKVSSSRLGEEKGWAATNIGAEITIDNYSKCAQDAKTWCQQGRVDLAVTALSQLQQHGLVASFELYGCVLQACCQKKALPEARKLHELISASALRSNDYLNNLVVDVYIKCGSLPDGLRAFDQLANRNALSWTALILGYTRAGQCHEAIRVYKEMQNAGTKPDRQTFVNILKACNSPDEATWLHAEVVKHRYGNDLFVCASLVAMYAKLGNMEACQDVFDGVLYRDIALWNALIAGYCQQGLYERALQLYTDMQVEGIGPNQRTFPSVLKACGNLAVHEKNSTVHRQLVKAQYLTRGKEIHAQVLTQGYELDEFVGNTLVHMYAQCGDMPSAKIVFDRLPKRDVVSWNALIGGYAEQEQSDVALCLFAQMAGEGTRPISRTFASLLKACGSQAATEEEGAVVVGHSVRLKALFQGRTIHAEVVRTACASDDFVGSALVHMYAKCGDLEAARHVFDILSEQNVVTWNAMIAGYVQQQKPEMALQLYFHMDGDPVQADNWTIASALKACCGLASLEEGTGQPYKAQALQVGKEIHATLVRRGYESDIFLQNCLVEMYAKCGSLADARLVCDISAHKDLISWNALIAGYGEHGQYNHALGLYSEVRSTGLRPDSWILTSVMKVIWGLAESEVDTPLDGQFVKVDALRIGEQVHADVIENGCQADAVVGGALINMYAKCGDMRQARRVFDEIPQQDVTLFTAIIAGYAEHEDVDKTWEVYSRMQNAGVRPDHVTYMSILKAFGNVGALKMCRRVHDDMLGTGKNWGPNVVTSLIHAYCKCSSIPEAQQVFDKFPERNLGSWNALIAGYAREGDYTSSLQLFEQLKCAGLKPDGVSFLCVIAACSHAGKIDKGMQLFQSMTQDYGITVTSRHCTCLVDLLGRAGHLEKVEELLLKMPNRPDLPAWLSLLGACRKYNDVKTGRRAFEHAVRLQPRHSAAYVLMSSTYSQAHMWEDADKIEELRQQAGAWKQPGQSWIEHEKKVHKFVVGERSHPQSEKLKVVVTELTTQMDVLGLLPVREAAS